MFYIKWMLLWSTTIISISATIISIIVPKLSAEELAIYRSVDDTGNIAYSDKPPLSDDYKVIQTPLLNGIKLENQTAIEKQLEKLNKSLTKTRTKRLERYKDKEQQCEAYEQAISRVEKQLKQRQKAYKFEQLKNQLEELRDKKRKDC